MQQVQSQSQAMLRTLVKPFMNESPLHVSKIASDRSEKHARMQQISHRQGIGSSLHHDDSGRKTARGAAAWESVSQPHDVLNLAFLETGCRTQDPSQVQKVLSGGSSVFKKQDPYLMWVRICLSAPASKVTCHCTVTSCLQSSRCMSVCNPSQMSKAQSESVTQQ